MSNKEWWDSLSLERRKEIASKGGNARAKKLKKARRREIAKMGGLRKSLIHKAKNQPIKL